jgi:hypothetical protein
MPLGRARRSILSNSVSVPTATHYYHVDQQGVVFNMGYFAFLEEVAIGGLPSGRRLSRCPATTSSRTSFG